jgi:predicted MPP superfamily phosphohydrolase
LEQLNRKDSLEPMNKMFFVPFISIVIIALDYYVWMAVKTAFQKSRHSMQQTAKYVFWGFTAFILLGIISYNTLPLHTWKNELRITFMAMVMISVFTKLFIIIFLLVEDITRFFRWGTNKIRKKDPSAISRHEFLSQAALAVGAVPAATFAFGIISGAHDYQVEKISLKLPKLPAAFKGLKIAQISDIHTGSFFNKTAVKGGVEMLMREKPDVIFFTGDLVNNESKEVQNYFDVFNKLKAPLGVYSTLGNHDYGDYVRWASPAAKKQNLKDLMKAHELMGWNLLMDEHRFLEESGEKLAIIGVQNIGLGRFPWYGNLEKAYKGTEEAGAKLLLSHDPTHWNAEVTKQSKFKDIDVAFAGHTHGAQFGVHIPGFDRWSPAKYIYKQWSGLYEENGQQLYVNRGYGYLGYPGRVGMPPEISIFTLS